VVVAGAHWPDPLQLRILVSTVPVHMAAAHDLVTGACTHANVVALQVPVLPHIPADVSAGQAVPQQILPPPALLDTHAPLTHSVLAVHVPPLGFKHLPAEHT